MTPFISDELDEIEKHYPDGWFTMAVKEAKSSTTRVSLNYIKKILVRWEKEGLPNKMNMSKKHVSETVNILLPGGEITEGRT